MKKFSIALIAGAFLATGSWGMKFIVIGTGGVTGVYYPTGGAICRLVNKYYKDKLGMKCSVESTGGSVYNINALRKGDLDFAIAQSDVVYQAFNGEGKFKGNPYKGLRVVMSIHPELLTLVVRKDAKIKNFFDLKGHRINIGNPGSGNEAAVKTLFDKCQKLKLSDLKVEQLKAAECPNGLKDKKIDGYFYMVGHPTANIKDAANSTDIDLIPLENVPAAEELVKEKPYYAWGVIPAGMYRGVNHPTKTYGVKAIFVTTDRMDTESVYYVTKTILEHFDQFKKMHPAYKNLTKKDLLKGFDPKMMHPGAVKAFKEEGLL
ncbi:MAG: TAXI family TRAP transporter solute-binding subunit [Campylobacterales bacterium]